MAPSTVLFHYGTFQVLWQRPDLLQAGLALADGSNSLAVKSADTEAVQQAFQRRGLTAACPLIHYTDPFLLRSQPLRGLRQWQGPKLLVCGDLHHGERPVDVLSAYLDAEPHDAVLLTFNPALLAEVRQRLRVPVRCLPPTFFRYPVAVPAAQPRQELLHVGSLGPHHPRRRELVLALQARGRIPFRHATTSSAEEAAALYAQHALVLNVPLNHDLNHRFFEVIAAGVPQVVFGDPALVGEHRHLAERPDVFWASTLEELEALVARLLAEPERLRAIPVAPPPYWELKDLLKAALAP
ncbi:glycosyltransferase [Cyanobium sp. WAJ14-Wanaka]|uniref:glycosyltransferase family protein n=1 Tax=Cyanobium sp. WAJ14-Wanaka TaxID=2823725 RepID=UPI0020CE583F|nr:glycosyltransferase [Cyanobium sp. WAJ14-Wanaka]MCP9775657.1 glycosyltransferase family 1 protein [Cyanobium sp. WAJ14-Wanaka]